MENEKTQIIDQFWQKVIQGEITQYDLSDPEHRIAYYDALGTDEESLKRDCPHLFHQISSQLTVQEKEGEKGFSTDPQASVLSTGKDNGMNGQARVNYTQNKPMIVMNSTLINTSSPDRPEACVNPYIKSGHIIEMKDLVLTPPFRPGIIETFELRNTSTAFRRDQSMEVPIAFAAPQFIRNNADVVERIEIDKPAKTKSIKYDDCCLIVYNRGTESGDNPDDTFSDVIVDKSKEPKVINYHQGFGGRIVLTEDWEIDYHNWTASGVRITAEFVNKDIGGSIQYQGTDNIKALFKSENPRILEWSFIQEKDGKTVNFENWKGELLANHVTNDAKLRFYAYIPFTVKPSFSDLGSVSGAADNVSITIKSEYPFDDPAISPANKQIWYIWIWWGCLGKDTRIPLADGRVLPIREVKSKDIVRTENGDLEVVSTYKGYEEEVIYLETDTGESLYASESHPIMTKRGLVRAENLNAGDSVKTPSGFVGLKSLYRKDYCDDVYGIQFSENSLLYCNGILTGDFGTQQEKTVGQESSMAPAAFDKENKAAVELLKLRLQKTLKTSKQYGTDIMMTQSAPAAPYTACSMLYPEDYFKLFLQDGSAEWDSEDGSFSLDFWAKISGESRSMVSQERGFRFGVDGDTLVFSLSGKGEISAGVGISIGDSWHHYGIIFDGKRLSLALDGIVMEESGEYDGCQIIQENVPLVFGNGFIGYMQKGVLYQRAVSIDQIRDRMFRYVCDSEDHSIFAFLDMSADDVTDIGTNRLRVESKGGCMVRNLVDGYRPSAGSYAEVKNLPQINPGGFGSKSFGIYLRFYSNFLNSDKGVLLSNGFLSEPDAVVLFMEDKGDDLLDISITVGRKEAVIAEKIPKFQWIDLVVSYEYLDGELTAYLNGQKTKVVQIGRFERKSAGNVVIGNGFSQDGSKMDYTCDCCYAMVAVFDNAVYESAVLQMSEQQPYLFDNKLAALYHFELQPPTELVSGQKIHLQNENVVTLESTVRQMTSNRYRYRIEADVKNYDADAVKLYKTLKVYYEQMFGLSSGNMLNKEILNAVYTYLSRALLSSKDIKQLFHVEKVTNNMLAKLLTELDETVTSVLLHLIYANNMGNELEDDMSAKLGHDNVCGKTRTIVAAGNYAAVYCRSKDFMKNIFDRMRAAITESEL